MLICLGSIASDYLVALEKEPVRSRPSVWVVTKVPKKLTDLKPDFLSALSTSPRNITVEENLGPSGFGMTLIFLLSQKRRYRTIEIEALFLHDLIFQNYGSQEYLKQMSGISSDQILAKF